MAQPSQPAKMAMHTKPSATGQRPVAIIVSKQRIVGATNGSSAYVLSLARAMHECGFDVRLVQPSPALAGRTPVLRFSPELDVFDRHTIRGVWRMGRYGIALSALVWTGFMVGALKLFARKLLGDRKALQDKPRPYSIALPWNENELRFVNRHVRAAGQHLRLLVADYAFGAEALVTAPDGIKTAIIMHDLFSARDGKGVDSVATLTEGEEVGRLSKADWVIAIQAEERDFAAHHCIESEAVLVPMPSEIVSDIQPGKNDSLLFIGSDTAPNSVGLRWFLDAVWPLVRAARPDAVLDVVGTVSRKFDTGLPSGVRLHGLVDDLSAFYRKAGVIISPLTFGSGLKVKLVEALGQGKAVVGTPVTLQGVEEVCADALICTDDPQDMARSIIHLSGSMEERRSLAERGLRCAAEHFSANTVHAEFRKRLEGLTQR